MIIIYSFTFLVLVIDLTSLLLTLKDNDIFQKSKSGKSWILVLPTIIEWLITIGFFINFRIRKKKLKSKIKKIINEKKREIKCYNNEREKIILKILKLQGRHFKNSYYENLLITILLFLFPIIIKIIIFTNVGFKPIFSVSASLFYGYNIIYELIFLIIKTKKRKNYNKELLSKKINNSYKSIDIVENITNQDNNDQDNNVSLGDIDIHINNNTIYERNNKIKSKISENYLSISYLVVKSLFGIFLIIYFTSIGEKLDDKTSSRTWMILFIPYYICFLPALLFCILHILSLCTVFKRKIWIPIITIIPCLLVFFINGIIIPLKLENKISLHESFITIFFIIGTIFLLIHLIVLNKYKNK